MKKCQVLNLGLIDFQKALDIQRDIFRNKHADEVMDTLIFAEHLPVYTSGRAADAASLIKGQLPKGVDLLKIDRGGSITYHGPGQLMIYPVISLPKDMNIKGYINNLEHMVSRAMAVYGVQVERGEIAGSWVAGEKLASIGIKVSSAITMHGMALNVNCDLRYFEPIRACGLKSKAISMQDILGYEVEMDDVIDLIVLNFGKVFNYQMTLAKEGDTDERHTDAHSLKD